MRIAGDGGVEIRSRDKRMTAGFKLSVRFPVSAIQFLQEAL